jgi:predicted MFS family arabinose efflux permease
LQAGFILGAVVAGAGGLLFIAFYHAPSATNAKIKNPSKGMSRLVAERWRTLAQPALRPIIVSGVALITAQYGIVLWVVLYLRDIFHIASERAALCLFLAQMAGVVGRISLAAWSDRCAGGRYRPVQVSIIALVGGFAALPSATAAGAPAAVIWMIIAWLGFFGLGWYGPWVAYVSEAAPPDQTGFTLGAVMAINQIAIVSTPPIIGTIIDRSGSYSLVWLCLSALMALAFVGARSAKASGSKKN